MWVEETISPSTSTSGTTRGSNAFCARSRSASPLALWPKRKFSPTDTSVGAELADEHVVDELLRPLGGERAVERDHHELAHAEAGDQVGLDVERGQQLRRGVGRDDLARVRLEGQHGVGAGDHLAVAEVHAVELADRDVARAASRHRGAR